MHVWPSATSAASVSREHLDTQRQRRPTQFSLTAIIDSSVINCNRQQQINWWSSSHCLYTKLLTTYITNRHKLHPHKIVLTNVTTSITDMWTVDRKYMTRSENNKKERVQVWYYHKGHNIFPTSTWDIMAHLFIIIWKTKNIIIKSKFAVTFNSN